jgi:hypothetical protein
MGGVATRPLGELLLCLAVVSSGCTTSEPPPPPGAPPGPVELEPQSPADPVEVANSGRTLSGVYVLERASPPESAATWVFTDQGAYSRSRTLDNGRGERTDSGTYVVDTTGHLILFVEQRGNARLSWAQRVTLGLGGEAQTAIVLTSLDGRAETLVRAGDAPAPGAGAPSAE